MRNVSFALLLGAFCATSAFPNALVVCDDSGDLGSAVSELNAKLIQKEIVGNVSFSNGKGRASIAKPTSISAPVIVQEGDHYRVCVTVTGPISAASTGGSGPR